MIKYSINGFANDILILLGADISDADKIESIKMFANLIKHMKKNKEI